jgi:DNA-binding CsgD family transcriptional regulator/tetratricopeptide (TPR) repeat protein
MAWATKLVGRGAELAELRRELQHARAGEFRIVLLLADPGIGKTRLAREFLARSHARVVGLSARAYPLGETASFGVWSEALESHLRGLPPDEITKVCGGFLDDLATLLHSVAAVRGSAQGEPSRLRLLEGFAVVLANLARRAPVVVFLDDAHLADVSSWEALGYLAGTLAEARVLVLAAARPVELVENRDALPILLRLEQDGALRRLELLPLDSVALAELAGAVLDDVPSLALVDWLAERSGGNALFALGLLQALVDEGADLSAPDLRSLPEELKERVAVRLSDLDETALATLELLAAVGRRVELREIVALTGLSPDQLAPILERFVRSRLAAEQERGHELTYELAHPLIQEATYQRMGAVRRRGLHRRIGRTLFAAGQLGEAAAHFACSAEIGDDEAIAALRDAVRQAEERGGYREALTILDALVELVPAGDERWLGVLEALSWEAEWVVDHRADAHALLGIKAMRAIEGMLETSPDPAPRAAIKFRLASFLGFGTGDLDEAERACAEAKSLFEQAGDHRSALLAENELAWLAGLRGDYATMRAIGERVVETADAIDHRFAVIQGLTATAQASFFRGRFAETGPEHLRALAIARQEGKSYRAVISLTTLACSLAAEGRAEEALGLVEEAKAESPSWRESLLPEWEAIVHWFGGDFRTALASAQEAAALRVGGLGKRRTFGSAFALLSAVEAGQPGQARRHLREVRGALGGRDFLCAGQVAGHAEALLAWQEGNPADALAGLRESVDRSLGTGAQPFAAIALVDLAELAADQGERELSAEAAGELDEIARRIDRDLYHGLAALAAGWSGDASAVARAVELLSRTDCRAFQARALDVYGRSLTDADRVDALQRAALAFDACGAVWRRDRTHQRLRSLGARGWKAVAAAHGPASLTRRERQVARLAAEGRTASEIAEQLFISKRTVESHLAHVYAKLGVHSRLDLVRRASELVLNQ